MHTRSGLTVYLEIMVAAMAIVGSLYASKTVHSDHGVARWVVVVLIYIFAIVFATTWAISMRIYSSEIQPASTRAGATSLAQSANWVRRSSCSEIELSLMQLLGLQLHCGAHHTDSSSKVVVCYLLFVWWMHILDSYGVYLFHAGNQGEESRSYR